MSDIESKGSSPNNNRVQAHKIFVTGLDGAAKTNDLASELRQLFDRYGNIESCVVKMSRNGDYCFAFIDYRPGENAEEAVRNLNGHMIRGKSMKVQLQDISNRRKDPDKGCYTCGRKGHFARECRSRNGLSGNRGRSRSRSHSRSRSYEHKKRRRVSQSSHSDRQHQKKSRRKHSSRERNEKRKKKHHRRRSSSKSNS